MARLDLAAIGALTLRSPDLARYPALRLAREVMAARGLAESTLARVTSETSLGKAASSLDDILAVDQLARVWARAAICARLTANQDTRGAGHVAFFV